MLRWAITFFIIALIAGALGLFRLAGMARRISPISWPLRFLILFVVSLIFGRKAVGGPPV